MFHNGFTLSNVKSELTFSANISFEENMPLLSLYFSSSEHSKPFDDAYKAALTESLKTPKTEEAHRRFALVEAKSILPKGVEIQDIGFGDSECRNSIDRVFGSIKEEIDLEY